MKQRWILGLLALQITFFGAWAWVEEGRKAGRQFVLATQPYDPRDLLAGQYMDLRYRDADLPTNGLNRKPVEGDTVWVYFDLAGSVTRNNKDYPLRRATRYEVGDIPPGPGEAMPHAAEGWAKAHYQDGRLVFGIERYYFSESRAKALNSIHSGDFYVWVNLAKDGQLRVKELIY